MMVYEEDVITETKAPELVLMEIMTGSFNSYEQSQADTSYFNISMHMVPIWQEVGVYAMYVEQALNSDQESPYRQRIYIIDHTENGNFVSYVYKIQEDERFIGKWKDPSFFDNYKLDILESRDGCEVYLKTLAPGVFKGSTKEWGCESTMRGAMYATSQVSIKEGEVTSWDRGYDSMGAQVWGAEAGPYIFKKIVKK